MDTQLNDLVLVKQQPTSHAIQGVTTKFQRPYEGPYIIQNMINPNRQTEETVQQETFKTLFTNTKYFTYESNQQRRLGLLEGSTTTKT
jgi:hypothetical protein